MRHSRSKVEWPKGIFCIHRARVENLSFLSFPKPLIKLYFQRSFVRSFVRSLVVHSSRKWCHCVCVCVCVKNILLTGESKKLLGTRRSLGMCVTVCVYLCANGSSWN